MGWYADGIEIGSVWHERPQFVRDMDHSGRMYEVMDVRNGLVWLDQPSSFTDAGYRLGGQRRCTMQIARFVKQFEFVHAALPKEGPGDGVEKVGVEHPADGTWSPWLAPDTLPKEGQK